MPRREAPFGFPRTDDRSWTPAAWVIWAREAEACSSQALHAFGHHLPAPKSSFQLLRPARSHFSLIHTASCVAATLTVPSHFSVRPCPNSTVAGAVWHVACGMRHDNSDTRADNEASTRHAVSADANHRYVVPSESFEFVFATRLPLSSRKGWHGWQILLGPFGWIC
ncbi:hypothetical protein BDP81DRAFT_179356 [Colletotrichum phormii]|uniref:Uncharacterized protein n=1 Tax=Colletotrichum phormii TaxID=359342 RepID=A0AAI9ZWN8_9PEZI|nr:uncharacterized protein BDP81DRAFT_179356 [Colletotrichum phormii]KAK1639553.1 hypothetical protein BDP81DRAFT_179356 [Colletotrichum phormii]